MRRFVFILFCVISFHAIGQDGFALIELYTSQGCSSCPAADRLLSELVDRADKDHKKVFALSFHVDYWNYIGWKDPYSSQLYSQRQRNYSKGIDAHRVYTPQMIVNGATEFVGSNREAAKAAIVMALRQKPKYEISIGDVKLANDRVVLTYQIDKSPGSERLNVALVERHLENFVPRGENHGKTLSHDNVVRAFETIALKKSGRIEVSTSDVNPENCSVILYIQDTDFTIVGALQSQLRQE